MTNRVAFDDNLFLLPEQQRQNNLDESLFSLATLTMVRNKEEPLQVSAETNANAGAGRTKSKRWRREAQATGTVARISKNDDCYGATPLPPKPSQLLPVKKRRRFSFSLYKDEVLARHSRHREILLQKHVDQKAGPPPMGTTHEFLAEKPGGRHQGKPYVRNARKAITPGKPTAIDAATGKRGDPISQFVSAFCSSTNQPSVSSPCVSAMADPTTAHHLSSSDLRRVESTDELKFNGLLGTCLRQPPSATDRLLPRSSLMIPAPAPPFLVSPAPAPTPLLPSSASSVAPVLQNASLRESIVASCASRALLEWEQREHLGAIMPAVVRSNNDMRNCNGSHPRAACTMGPALLRSHDHNQQHHQDTPQVLSIHQRAVLCVLLELQGAQTLNNNASTALL